MARRPFNRSIPNGVCRLNPSVQSDSLDRIRDAAIVQGNVRLCPRQNATAAALFLGCHQNHARERAKRLEGRFELSGPPGEGTTVRIVIPLEAAAPAAPPDPVIV